MMRLPFGQGHLPDEHEHDGQEQERGFEVEHEEQTEEDSYSA